MSRPVKDDRHSSGRAPMHGDIKTVVNGGSKAKHPTPMNIGEIVNMSASHKGGGAKIEKIGKVMGNK